jgi:hypothetical protein
MPESCKDLSRAASQLMRSKKNAVCVRGETPGLPMEGRFFALVTVAIICAELTHPAAAERRQIFIAAEKVTSMETQYYPKLF